MDPAGDEAMAQTRSRKKHSRASLMMEADEILEQAKRLYECFHLDQKPAERQDKRNAMKKCDRFSYEDYKAERTTKEK